MAEIRNPNLQAPGTGGGSGSGGDMRSTMVFLLVMLVVLLGFQYFKPKASAPAAQPQTHSQPLTGQSTRESTQGLPPVGAGSGQSSAAVVAATVVAAPAESLTTVENENYRIVFTNRGAQVKSWVLKKYFDSVGKPLDLVQPQAAALVGLPLSLYTYEPTLDNELNKAALYQVTASGTPLSASGHAEAPATSALTFHYVVGSLDVVKTFRFDSSYVIGVETEVKRNGSPVRALLQWPGGLGDQIEPMHFSYGKFVWSSDGKDDSTDAKKVVGNATFDQPYNFAAIIDLYFAAAFLPDDTAHTSVVTLHNTIDLPADASDPNSQKKPADVIGLAVGDSSGITRMRLFAGPKRLELLKTIYATGTTGKPDGPSLEPLIQFGMWSFIAKPLYLALRFLHDHLGNGVNNWGWAIILFTALFNVIMLPTRFWAMKSSLKMMRIQPKVDAIKNRFKNLKATDPKRAEMNTEMMALYKNENVNMYGSCLPMLPQIPLFFAYFRVLQNAVELRQAHWFWLTDLSAPDPKYILPILIIVSMFLTQFITPSPGMDPAQRKMMAFMMPVLFGFMLLHYASGLALYWGTSNIINLALQLAVNQSSMGQEMHAIAARRAAKKSGNNLRTIQGRR